MSFFVRGRSFFSLFPSPGARLPCRRRPLPRPLPIVRSWLVDFFLRVVFSREFSTPTPLDDHSLILFRVVALQFFSSLAGFFRPPEPRPSAPPLLQELALSDTFFTFPFSPLLPPCIHDPKNRPFLLFSLAKRDPGTGPFFERLFDHLLFFFLAHSPHPSLMARPGLGARTPPQVLLQTSPPFLHD